MSVDVTGLLTGLFVSGIIVSLLGYVDEADVAFYGGLALSLVAFTAIAALSDPEEANA